MKKSMIALAVGVTMAAGCQGLDLATGPASTLLPSATPSPTATPSVTAPSATPSATMSPSADPGVLQGRLTFDLGTNKDPGQMLTARLRTRSTGSSANLTAATQTALTDTRGNYTFFGLPSSDYQLEYDDEGKVTPYSFNSVGVAVSDPVAETSTQTVAPAVNMELAWDFTSAAPAPNANVTHGGPITFSFQPKDGVTGAVYEVTIFSTPNTGSGALQSFPSDPATATSATSISGTLNSNVTAGTVYYVVKYWKSGGTFNGPNFYGQTKPIPLNIQ